MQDTSNIPATQASNEKDIPVLQEKPVYEICKRIFDIIVSGCAMLLLSPIFLIAAIAIKCQDGGKVLYVSTRLTKNNREFRMYKFRSMVPGAEQMLDSLLDRNEVNGPAFKIREDPRITKVGRILRRTSIVELPQLLNVFKGDMTIIGPRPPLPREVAQYTPYQMHRLDVKTGLACYHEVYGRSDATDFDEWVEEDLKYIRERSMLTDIKVMLRLVKVVLLGKDAC